MVNSGVAKIAAEDKGARHGVGNKRKLETATVTTEVTTLTLERPVGAYGLDAGAVDLPMAPKRSKLEDVDGILGGKEPVAGPVVAKAEEEEGEVYTITTRYRKDYEILLKVCSCDTIQF